MLLCVPSSRGVMICTCFSSPPGADLPLTTTQRKRAYPNLDWMMSFPNSGLFFGWVRHEPNPDNGPPTHITLDKDFLLTASKLSN